MAEAVDAGSGLGDGGEKIGAACLFATVSEVHDSLWRAMSHDYVNCFLNIELAALVRVILKAPRP